MKLIEVLRTPQFNSDNVITNRNACSYFPNNRTT